MSLLKQGVKSKLKLPYMKKKKKTINKRNSILNVANMGPQRSITIRPKRLLNARR